MWCALGVMLELMRNGLVALKYSLSRLKRETPASAGYKGSPRFLSLRPRQDSRGFLPLGQ